MSISQAAFNFIENRISPIAGRLSTQRHIMAIRDGFISAMPFMIVKLKFGSPSQNPFKLCNRLLKPVAVFSFLKPYSFFN